MTRVVSLADLERAKDLSTPPLSVCTVRGRRRGYRLTEGYGEGVRRHLYTSVFFSIHSGSHSDLPYDADWREIKREVPNAAAPPLEGEERVLLTMSYFRPRVFDCAIVDMTHKLDLMGPYEEEVPDVSLKVELLKKDLSKASFQDLYSRLEITAEEIKESLTGVQLKVEHPPFLLFKTGWDKYHDESQITHPRLESWHLYLTHPYLSHSGVNYLIQNNIPGVGSDTVGLESPMLNFVSSNTYQEHVSSKLIQKLRLQTRTLHTLFLSTATKEDMRYILLNLNLRPITFQRGSSQRAQLGKLVMVPFCLSYPESDNRIDDAVPIAAYFIPDSTQ